jgi:hypothetical protein
VIHTAVNGRSGISIVLKRRVISAGIGHGSHFWVFQYVRPSGDRVD